PAPVPGATIAWVAGIGILVNGVTTLLFARGRQWELNVRSAFLHLAVDAMVSAGVVIAGLAIMMTGLVWLDPVVSLIVSAAIIYGTWDLVRQAIGLALD